MGGGLFISRRRRWTVIASRCSRRGDPARSPADAHPWARWIALAAHCGEVASDARQQLRPDDRAELNSEVAVSDPRIRGRKGSAVDPIHQAPPAADQLCWLATAAGAR